MSKVVRVSNGDYRITTRQTGTIVLDTNPEGSEDTVYQGTVIITGNLDVKGATTTIESSSITLADKILYLNVSEGNFYGTNGPSGISIGRGNYSDVQIFVDDTGTDSTHDKGVVVFNKANGTLVPIRTNKILVDSSGGDLTLIGNNSGNSIVTVAGTGGSYQTRIFNYTNYQASTGPLTLTSRDADGIPNAQAVADFVTAAFQYSTINRIIDGDTSVTAQDDSQGHSPSRIDFKVNNSLRATLTDSGGTHAGWTVDNVNMYTDTVSNTTNNLKLTAATNNIQVQGYLNLDNQSSDITTGPSGTTKIYTKSLEGPGRTGIYFTNNTAYGDTAYNNDELISKNRAVLLSILL